ncbi:YhgE/Pip domain-containing protein [Clostridium sp.]|uniref:YhgE/Pip domain-containing protein n=1 Tax=Clostridium sp. TaxID=1506 RepID=UPI00290A3D17|nr:YhgE/Pip domain-containing protein [Clostridium sp.]MDU5106489.1 YhgE/Pip domain-containing protein [Clostridium sp.]
MNFLRIAKEDIKGILNNRFIRVSIIAIIIVPLLYSLLYLYAFWDPYSKLEDVHVAVVNNDKGTVMDGESVNYGKDIEDELRNNNEIGWVITSEEEANDGLEGNGYYAKVVIPEDFSSKVTSAKEGKPELAKIQFVTNDKKNFLAAQINSKVQSELKGKITNKISSNYIEVAFDSLYEAKDGLTQAADGSKKLNDGLSTLNNKVPELADGANELSDGSSQLLNGQLALNNGINEVSNGSQALNAGLSQLYGKVPTLSNGVTALSNGASDLSKGISTANSGSQQIADGSKALYNAYTSTIYPSVGQLKSGANQLNEALNAGQEDIAKLSAGANTIANKSDAVSAGYAQVSDGINKLVAGVSSSSDANAMVTSLLTKAANETDVNVKNALINQALQITEKINEASKTNEPLVQSLLEGNNNLKTGIVEYTAGSKALANGTTSLISKVGQVQQGVGQLSSGLNQLNAGLDPSSSEFGIGLKTIADSTANLSNGLNTINTGASRLTEGANELNSNIPTLSSGITDLYNGSTALANGTTELSSGSNKLVNGQQELNSGITKLTSAVPELTDGVNKLYDGSKELSDKLGEGADKLKNGLVNSAKDMGEFASQAINMNSEAINKIPNYGTGFAPYFMPLSLWIGAIMMFFVIPSKLKDEENLSNFDIVAGKYLSYAFVGILQAILVSTVVLMLGLKPTNIGVYYLTNIFLSLVFVAIVQCFISLFGDAGRLLSIILLILQLTACAGTFPLEVLPKFFKALYPFMPFTYAVQALREVISADVINYSIVGKDLLILGLILVIFLAISVSLKKVGEKITSAIEGRKSDVTA